MIVNGYRVVIERDESGWFVVSVPTLRGCYTQGKTREEAVANAREAIDLFTGRS